MKFEEKLQSLRKASGLTQEEFADKLGVSRQSVSKWESGSSYPEMDKLVMMGKIFNCSMDDLLNDDVSDLTAMKETNKKKNNYFDSLLEFITKTVNMFLQMKFMSGLKCIIEMCVFAIILFVCSMIIMNVVDYVGDNLFTFLSYGFRHGIMNFIDSIVLLVLFILCIVILVHIFKTRYLDYYDKLVYEFEQKKNEENKDSGKLLSEESKKKNVKIEPDKKAKIIIRDDHKPFAFLTILTKMIIFVGKFFAFGMGLFFAFTFVSIIVGLVLSICLSFDCSIFIGVILCFLAAALVNFVVIKVLYKFVFNLKSNSKVSFVMLISASLLLGIGIATSIFEFRNFTVIDDYSEVDLNKYDYISYKSETFNMRDDVPLRLSCDESIKFEFDESRDDVLIEFEYNSIAYEPVFDENNYYVGNVFKNPDIKYVYDSIINDLKNKVIRVNFDNNYNEIKITSNKKNIKKLIKNLSKYYHIDYKEIKNGYEVFIGDSVYTDGIYECELNEDGFYQCNEYYNHGTCNIKYDKKGKVVIDNNCNCVDESTYGGIYSCYDK